MLIKAPHRLGFFLAALMLALTSMWWCFELAGRSLGWQATPVVPATLVHAVLMSLGFMPLFFCGFLFTAGPKWLQLPEVEARVLLRPLLSVALGWMLLWAGAWLHHGLAAAGAALAMLGWLAVSGRFALMVRRSPAADRVHASLIALAYGVGVLVMAAVALGLATQAYGLVRAATLLGLWWFIVPVYVAVSHRMIPFFTAAAVPALDAWRPNWLLWTMLSVVGLQGLWVLLEALGVQAPGLAWARGGISALSGALLLALAWRWGLVQSLRIRMLAMLHLGFVWLGVAFCLDALVQWLGQAGGVSLGLLPLHALTMGFLASVMVAMVTRVSCGHGGRTLTADNVAWGLFWGLQLATVLRLFSAYRPGPSGVWLLAAATVWALVMGGWALRYGRWYGRPRLDGRPG